MQVKRHSRLSCKPKIPECMHVLFSEKCNRVVGVVIRGCGARAEVSSSFPTSLSEGFCQGSMGYREGFLRAPLSTRLWGVSRRRTSRVSSVVPGVSASVFAGFPWVSGGVSAGVSVGFPWVSGGFRRPCYQECVYGTLRFIEVLARSSGFPAATA